MLMHGMRVLVTGSEGFIGSHIARLLESEGAEVIRFDSALGTEQSITSTSALASALHGATHVVHAAAFVSVPESIKRPLESHETNVTGTLNVLSAAHDAHVVRFVFISSSAVYGSTDALPASEELPIVPESPYAAQKAMGEMYTHLMGNLWNMETVRLRLFNVYGPGQRLEGGAVIPRFISAMKHGDAPTIFGTGDATRDFVFVEDVARAVALSLIAPDIAGGVFNIGSGVETSLNDVVRTINTAQGTTIVPEYREARVGDITRSVANVKRAEDGFGFRAAVSFEEGVRKTITSFV